MLLFIADEFVLNRRDLLIKDFICSLEKGWFFNSDKDSSPFLNNKKIINFAYTNESPGIDFMKKKKVNLNFKL